MAADCYREQVDRFILAELDTVPHLEALLILWNCRPKSQSADNIAHLLYVHREVAAKVLADLVQRNLVASDGTDTNAFRYNSRSPETDTLMHNVETMHRTELIRISGLIHSKASAAVRDFARAFRFKKDRD